MNRRSFLKSVAGFVATVAASTVVRPAKAAYRVIQHFTGWNYVAIAGEPISAGHLVTIKDGKAYLVNASDIHVGIALNPTPKGNTVQIATSGTIHVWNSNEGKVVIPPRWLDEGNKAHDFRVMLSGVTFTNSDDN